MRRFALVLPLLFASVSSSQASTLYYASAVGSTGGGSAGASSSFYSISTATGVDSFVSTISGVFYTDLASSPIPDTMYAVDEANGLGCLQTFNVATTASIRSTSPAARRR